MEMKHNEVNYHDGGKHSTTHKTHESGEPWSSLGFLLSAFSSPTPRRFI